MRAALKSLQAFVMTVESGSMAAAAKMLSMSTSAVSQQIKRLEQDTQLRLLHRNTRRLALTEPGEVIYRYGKKMLQASMVAEQEIDQLRQQPLGLLRLFVPVGFAGSGILSTPFKYLLENYEHLKIELTALDEPVDMVAQKVDIALKVGIGALPDSALVARHIADWEVGFYAAPSYLSAHGDKDGKFITSMDDLTALDWLQHVNEDYDEVLLTQAKIQVNNMQVLTRLVCDGLGFGILPEPEVRTQVKAGTLIRLLPQLNLPRLSIYAVTTHRAPHPAKITATLDAITQSFAKADILGL